MNKNLKERSIRDEDLQRLAQRYKDDDREALKEILLDKNVKRMIEAIVVQHDVSEYGMTIDDMLGYVHLDIIEKLDQYNPSKSNLLTWLYIRASSTCVSAIQSYGYEIRIPRDRLRLSAKIQKAEEELYQRLEREPTLQEVSEETGISMYDIGMIKVDMFEPDQYSHSICDEDGGDRWEDFDSDIVQPDASFAPGGLGRQEWLEMFEELTENESKVMVLHYFHGRSFQEIAKFLDLTDRRIRQIHDESLQKLREIAKSEFIPAILR